MVVLVMGTPISSSAMRLASATAVRPLKPHSPRTAATGLLLLTTKVPPAFKPAFTLAVANNEGSNTTTTSGCVNLLPKPDRLVADA